MVSNPNATEHATVETSRLKSRASPPLTLKYLGGQGEKFLRNISPDHVKYIVPPHVFFWFRKNVGGVLRMPHFSPEMV